MRDAGVTSQWTGVNSMKSLALLALLLTGCATQPPTPFQQQMILMQMSRPAYQLPPPPPMAQINRQVTCYTNGNVTTCQ
jgi:uncharacterized protein YcfL